MAARSGAAISPSPTSPRIVNFCNAKYEECGKYQTLASREAKGRLHAGGAIGPRQPRRRRGGDMTQAAQNRGWIVTLAGTAINLALGILYTWSIFKGAIKASIEKGGPGAFQLGPGLDQRPLCRVLPGVRLRDDRCRQVPGQDRSPRHRACWRAARRRRLLLDLPDHQLCGVDPRFRRSRGHRHRVRLLVGDPARPQVVPAGQDGTDRRPGGQRLRAGLRVHRAARHLAG